ncbi:MAG TPA: 4-alpha-glucanotransferase [Gaiellaceae bacterium]
MQLPRSSGILLHPTSLASRKLNDEAYRFVDWLAAAGQSWWSVLPLGPPDDYGSPYAAESAFAAWRGLLAEPKARVSTRELEDFVARHPYWVGDWAAFAGGEAIADQVRFEREWTALRTYARGRGIRIIGDLPIYVAQGGADHRSHPELFQEGFVAGAPPDDFSANGQLWGNPLYEWPVHRASAYRWWTERLRRTFELVDVTRVDHFRGFVSYWSVPAGRKTARSGAWKRGPGAELFRAVESRLGELPLIAEDLGKVTKDVFALRDELGIPGMAVMIFGFDGSRSNPHRLENHRENQVVYTTTHDMDTARGWYEAAPQRLRDATGFDPREPHWGLIEAAFSSRARLALLQMQDVLGLGSDARMNYPGRAGGNWRWKLRKGQLTDALARRLRDATTAAGRAA